MQHSKNTVLLFGRPGSGKGTQAKVLSEKLGWTHFSTGNRFKELRDGDGALSERVRAIYDAGQLMPDWFATYLLQDTFFNLGPEQGIVCEGYPRSTTQAQIFDDIATWLDRPYVVLDLAVSEDETIRRQMERAQVEHRPDSATREQIEARLATYREHTEPVLDFFREKGALVSIDGELSPQGVAQAISEALAS